jgi:peptidoglycan/xylan/chitin deacetylase (PgdA/CDA1 family)
MSNRIVVFTGILSYSVRKGIVEIDRAIPDLSWLIVLHSPKKDFSTLLRNQWRNFKRNGWRWLPYQFGEILSRIDNPVQSVTVRGGKEFTQSGLMSRSNLQFLRVDDLHAASTLQEIKKFKPDLGISLAAPILRRPLFAIPTLGTVNLHKGKLPDYRGMPPAFWELWNDEKSVGCSVHWVDEKLDTGAVVAHSSIDREGFSTLRGLQLRLDEVGVDLMRTAVLEIVQGTSRSVPQPSGGRTYRKPTLTMLAALNRKLSRNQSPQASRVKGYVKNAFGTTTLALWQTGLHHVLTPRITVILYHRVNDSVRDNLTVGIEQFDRQMGLLRENCQPVSIEEVLASKVVPRSRKPAVCVTFDDGYLDNYLNAVPILLRHEIPAAFFVATGIVSNGGRFQHDIRRGNPPIPVMQWQQLREMRTHGFTIGSHSVSHIDCAAEPAEVVRCELARSYEDIRRELLLKEVIFAYPYGGREHMTSQRLALVKEAGYSGCLSAYGGANVGTVDRFNVLRRPINCAVSDKMFILTCLGLGFR